MKRLVFLLIITGFLLGCSSEKPNKPSKCEKNPYADGCFLGGSYKKHKPMAW